MLDLNTIPFPFAILIYLLSGALVLLVLVLPLLLIVKTEIPEFKRWWFENITQFKQHNDNNPDKGFALCYAANLLSSINVVIGRLACWLVLTMVLMQFLVVLMRYVFSYGSTQMQESIWYMHGLIFTLGVGYTLYREGHVRIDVIYRTLPERTKAWINVFGVLFFVIPVCWVTLEMAYPYVSNAWKVKEGSIEGAGLHYVYLIKSSILVFAVLLLSQGISLMLKSLSIILYRSSLSHRTNQVSRSA